MKKIAVLLITALLPMLCLAQESDRTWQLELSVGGNYPLSKVEGMKNSPFMKFGIEYRRRIAESPLWIGGTLTAQSVYRLWSEPRGPFADDGRGYRTLALMATAEYRFYENRTLSLFAGTGMGVAERAGAPLEGENMERNLIGFVAAPRVGIQLWNHFRVSLDFNLTAKPYNTAALTLGWAF